MGNISNETGLTGKVLRAVGLKEKSTAGKFYPGLGDRIGEDKPDYFRHANGYGGIPILFYADYDSTTGISNLGVIINQVDDIKVVGIARSTNMPKEDLGRVVGRIGGAIDRNEPIMLNGTESLRWLDEGLPTISDEFKRAEMETLLREQRPLMLDMNHIYIGDSIIALY